MKYTLVSLFLLISLSLRAQEVYVHVSNTDLYDFLHQQGLDDVIIERAAPGIEDIFMDLMKQPMPA